MILTRAIKYITLLSIIFVTGCAKNGLVQYNELVENSEFTTKTYKDALLGGKIHPIPKSSDRGFFNPGDFIFEIDESDPVFDHSSFKGNYKIFYFDAAKGDEFFIRIESLLRDIPFAFDARYMQPWTEIVDENGNEVPHELYDYSTKFEGVSYKIKGSLKKKGKFFLILGADNRMVGKESGTMGLYYRCQDIICIIPEFKMGSRTSTYNPFGKVRLSFGLNL